MGGFGQVIVRADFEARHFIVQLGLGGEHEDGCIGRDGILAQLTGHFVPVHIGHHHVQEDQVWLLFHSLVQSLPAIGSRGDLITLALEHQTDQAQGVYIIVHD